jgi:hypothetical protein
MSLPTIKQNSSGFFMPVSSLQGIVYAITNGSGSGGSFQQGGFNFAGTATVQQAYWGLLGNNTVNGVASPYLTSGNPYLSSINGAGAGLLKDLGRTVVSAGRTFRKVQLVVNASRSGGTNFALSTNGVAGQINTTPIQDFLTGYIEFGFEGTGPSAPVVQYGV